jgi:phospholipid/cholesterol/gamma-HCH transport system permease protein
MAAVTRLARPVRRTSRAIGDVFEDIGKQLVFYAEVFYEIFTQIVLRLKYRNVVFNLVSDITIGAGALIVGGGMIFVIFSMSFFTGTEVGLQGFKGLEQIGAEAFTGLIGSFANTREVTPLIAGVAFAAQVGAGFTAELGAMRISEEIDAL